MNKAVKLKGVIRPIRGHFTEVPNSELDKKMGDILADYIGDTWIFSDSLNPVEQWTEIAKVLRLHGVEFTCLDAEKS